MSLDLFNELRKHKRGKIHALGVRRQSIPLCYSDWLLKTEKSQMTYNLFHLPLRWLRSEKREIQHTKTRGIDKGDGVEAS